MERTSGKSGFHYDISTSISITGVRKSTTLDTCSLLFHAYSRSLLTVVRYGIYFISTATRTVEYINFTHRGTVYRILDTNMVLNVSYLANCKDPGLPLNGARTGNGFQHGRSVTFTCNNGYTLIGGRSMDCRNGVWSSSLPQCKSKLIWNEYHVLVVHIFFLAVTLFQNNN